MVIQYDGAILCYRLKPPSKLMLLIDFVRRCNFMLSIETAVQTYVIN